jgi:hypothetical protein
MGGSFDERRKNFEDKWAHDEELRFKVMARRDKLLGHWAAEQLGLKAPETEAYVKAIVHQEMKKHAENEILQKLRTDFDAKKVTVSDHMIRRKMEELLELAGDQVVAEHKKK